MTLSRKTARRPVVIAFVVALVLGPFVAWQGAQGGQTHEESVLAPRGIVVVGDSITARYNDSPGDERQGWWSIVGHRFGADVRTYAQSGSGYLRPGHRCEGNRFIDRTEVYAGAAPSILFVEGGRNDWARCADGMFVPSTDHEIDHAVGTYLDTVKTFVPATTRVIVLGPPWGPLDARTGVRITGIVRAQAEAHGFEFISTAGALTASRVVDGVHPNRHGSAAIARRVIRALE
ncbi:hypothetical protein GEV29_16895 [Aeromicrobium sp. SMF47]|uniref:SGNH/GDSL hydrolase family protein n=1 Tax=Aeromicrobium TaxID=2040 RepID=UPI00129D359A|nr:MULTISPECIES: SGNH/GDSL hydrolase family protein [Aeromicrobium]MRJ78212.1 hypothetical protein [Aeromicrobium yanjiei]MRK03157.1 hypothetical protein [Aeromicrobium sp. S22]